MRIDSYTLFARALPLFLTVLPVALLPIALLPLELKLPTGGVAGVAFALLSFSLGQVAADAGKRKEKRLWDGWGGPPTTRFLRHDNPEFNAVTRQRVHTSLRSMGLDVPTRERQLADPQEADMHFESCTHELIRKTRDRTKYPLVFEALTGYGFRRNLFALKCGGLILSGAVLAVCVWRGVASWGANGPPPSIAVAILLNAGLLTMWVTWVNENNVKLGADRYARFLLEAAL